MYTLLMQIAPLLVTQPPKTPSLTYTLSITTRVHTEEPPLSPFIPSAKTQTQQHTPRQP